MWRRKLIIYSAFFIGSLIFLAIDHRGVSTGDYLFRALGLSPWSDGRNNQGLHYSVVIGIVLLLISGQLLIHHLRTKYDRVGLKIVVFSFIFFILFPVASRWLFVVGNLNSSGLSALDYSSKDYNCSFRYSEDEALYVCTIKLFNYGKQQELVEIKPYFDDPHSAIIAEASPKIEYKTIVIPPRSDSTYTLFFDGLLDHEAKGRGFTSLGGVVLKQDDVEKVFIWK